VNNDVINNKGIVGKKLKKTVYEPYDENDGEYTLINHYSQEDFVKKKQG
jgi:hypothetical protein